MDFPPTADEFERLLFLVMKQAFEEAKETGTGWVRFTQRENGRFSVESIDPNLVSLATP